jgi:hypothetical protein
MVDESRLILIISQPRSGSTLTQKLLSNNSSVDTVSEPWLLLPFLSIYKPDLINAKYNYSVALRGFFDYLNKKEAVDDFRDDLKRLILNQYKVSVSGQYFIDKTPRYYEILDEIFDLFPQAKFLILKRNPFASLLSMLKTWSGGKIDYSHVLRFHRDFLTAPSLIQEFFNKYEALPNVRQIRYEDILENPSSKVKELYDWLEIPFDEDVLQIGKNNKVKGIFGDDVYKHEALENVKSGDSSVWTEEVRSDRKLSRFFNDYQDFLTADFIQAYGYESFRFKTRPWELGKSDFSRLLERIRVKGELV